jgi:hypothetical protein
VQQLTKIDITTMKQTVKFTTIYQLMSTFSTYNALESNTNLVSGKNNSLQLKGTLSINKHQANFSS